LYSLKNCGTTTGEKIKMQETETVQEEQPFKMVLGQPELLTDNIKTISHITTEIKIYADSNGLHIIAMDPANVSLIIYDLFSCSAQEYRIKEDFDFSVNTTYLYDILKNATKNDIVVLEIENHHLKVTLRGSYDRTYQTPLIEIDQPDQKIPDLNTTDKWKIDGKVLKEIIKTTSKMAETVKFSAVNDTLIFSAEGEINKIEIPAAAEKVISSGAICKYSLEYLRTFTDQTARVLKQTQTAKIEYGKDYPLILTYTATDKFNLKFILAPRVENE